MSDAEDVSVHRKAVSEEEELDEATTQRDDDADHKVPSANNRVRKMARMFEALAEAESSGVRTTTATRQNSDESGASGSDNEMRNTAGEDDDDDNGDDGGEQFADAERHRRTRHDDAIATAPKPDKNDDEGTMTRSLVQRLKRAFERLAANSSGDGGDYDDEQDEKQLDVRGDVNNNHSTNDDDDAHEKRVQSARRRSELHVHLKHDEESDDDDDDDDNDGNVVAVDVTDFSVSLLVGPIVKPDHVFCESVSSNNASSKLYSDLEHIRAGDCTVRVDFATMSYGQNDSVGLAEFYSDLEIVRDRVVVILDINDLHYGASMGQSDHNDEEDDEPPAEARNVYITAADAESDHFDDSEFSDDDNESSIDEPNTEETVVAPPVVPLNKVPHIIDELLTNEQSYIQTLTRAIDVYISVYDADFENAQLPVGLLGQKYHLFGNIERIRDFHADTFFPSLQRCDPTDVGGICETFCRFCTEHSFYMYVLYAINSKRGDQIATQHREFFAQRQLEYGDRLGLNSFLLQPIQRLPRYQLLLRELIRELAKRLDVTGVKEQIASCCRAEKHLQRLLDQVNSSMTINDIVDNSEVNVLQLGKFRFLNEFEVYECDSRRRYRGKLFLFDRGVLVTEQLDKETLQYRGFFTRARLGLHELDQNSFALFDQRRNVRQVELATEVNAAQLWMSSLAEVVQNRERISQQRQAATRTSVCGAGSAEFRDSGISDDAMSLRSHGGDFVVVRNPGNTGNTSSVSNAWSSGVSAQSEHSSGSYDSDSKRTTWYTNVDSNLVRNGKTLERLLNSEKHFIQILTKYHCQYLANVPPQRAEALRKYTRIVQTLIDYHQTVHYPQLRDSQMDIVRICTTFRQSLANSVYLEAYQMYAAACTKAYAQLDAIYEGIEGADIVHYTSVPLDHLDRTYAFMDHLMCELKNADDAYVSDEFKAVAVVGVELNRFRQRVRDNLNLNSIKNYTTNFEEDYGLVEWGEACTVYGWKTRLLVLTKGLICVRTRISTKTGREKFTDIEFQLPRSAVRTSESNRSRARLKFFASYAKEIEFKVDFPTEPVKLAMQRRIDVFGNMNL